MISDVIDINAGPGIGELKAFADAAGAADEKFAALRKNVSGGLGFSAAGPDKLAAAWDKAAASVQASAGKIAAAQDKLSAGMPVGAGADKLAASMEKAAASIEAAARRASASMGRLSSAARSATGGLDSAAGAADKAASSSDRLAGAADAGAGALDRQAVAGERAGKSGEKAAAGGTKFWDGLKTVMLGAGVAAAYGIDKAMKFQSQMLLLHTQAGVSVGDTKKMSQGALLISTQTGQSLSSVAESAYHVASNMASMGSTVPQMLHAVGTAAKGAAVGHANMVDVTNALTAAIASGIPGVKNYDSAMGMLNATVGSGDMSMQDLSEAFGTGMVASVKGYGLSLKDVGAGLAVFGDNNIRGAKAGTDMRMAVQSLAVPMSSAKKELAALGLTQHSLAKDMQSGGLLKALDDLNGRFKAHGITAKNEGQVITDLFGKKAGVGLSLLMEQMDRLQSKYPAITKGANDFGRAWQATQQSPAQKWKEAVAGLQASATGFGTEMLPAFTSALGVVNKILAAINGSKSGARDMALAFGGIAALFTAKKLTSGIESAFKTGETALRGVGKVAEVLKIPGLDKLAGIGKDTGAATMAGAASTNVRAAGMMADAASANLRAAGMMDAAAAGNKESAAAGHLPGVRGTAAAEGEAAAAGLGSKARTAGGVGVAGILAAVLGQQVLSGISSGPGGKNWWENPFGMAGPHDKGSSGNWLTSWTPYEHALGSARHDVASYFSGSPPAAATVPSARSIAIGGYQQAFAPPPARPAAPELPAAGYTNASLRAGTQIKIPAPQVAKPKVPAPDLSAFESAMSSAMRKPVKLAAPDTSALTAAKAKAGQQAAQIHQNMQTELSKKAKMAPPDLSAAQAAVGQARSVGTAIAEGLASGIRSGIPDISAAAAAASAAAAVSMAHTAQTHSPSRVTYKIGQDTGKGFEHGIRSRVSHVKAAAKQLSEAAAASLRTGLLGGQSAIDATMTALGKGPRPQDVQAIDQATAKLVSQVPKGHSALVTWMHNENTTLDRLAARRSVLMAEITDAQQITTSAISSASIVTAGSGSYTPALAASNGPIAASQTIQGLQYMAGDQSEFAGQIAQLKKAGLNATSLDQLTQAGAQQGLPVAMGLLQGGPGAIRQANQLEKSIIGSAGKLGDTGGPAMYQAGVDAGNAAARGLKSQLGTVESVMSQIAGKMVGALKSVLGHGTTASKKAATSAAAGTAASAASSGTGAGTSALHIPSLGKLAQMASTDAAALARDASAGNASAAALTRLASAANRAYAGGHSGGGHHGGGGGGGTTVNVTVNVTVQGTLVHQSDLADHLQGVLLQHGSQNWQSGIILPGRHT